MQRPSSQDNKMNVEKNVWFKSLRLTNEDIRNYSDILEDNDSTANKDDIDWDVSWLKTRPFKRVLWKRPTGVLENFSKILLKSLTEVHQENQNKIEVDVAEPVTSNKLIKSAFQLNDACSTNNRVKTHHSGCTSNYDTMDTEKENSHFNSPAKHDNDISLYGSTSPSATSEFTSMVLCSPSPKQCREQTKPTRQPMEDFDLNSQDSGYGHSFIDRNQKSFGFGRRPASVAKKSSEALFDSPKTKAGSSYFPRFSIGSMESMDDGFQELGELTSVDENAQLPSNFTSLMSGSLRTETPVSITVKNRPTYRRSVSLKETTPRAGCRAKSCLFKPDSADLGEGRPFKRPEPPTDPSVSPVQPKRYKCNDSCASPVGEMAAVAAPPRIQRSFSHNEATIKSAVQRSSADPDLIGDYSKPFCLPLVSGRHQDLKSISPETLADLMHGKYDYMIESFKVIDCRYPYEYEGGHIGGAYNIYTKEKIITELVEIKNGQPRVEPDLPKRDILIFHCEFSSERGPNLSRYLRSYDRTRNNDYYPALHYPEMYLLDGGYKNFYQEYAQLCVPVAYLPMLDPAHESDLRHFRAKSRTWNVDARGRPPMRSINFKRLGFP